MNLNQITIPSLDVERAVKFYQKLGLELIVYSANHYARFVCDNKATFSIHQVDNLPKGEGIWIYFERKDLDSYVEQLQSKGIIFEELSNDKPWLWREARLKDLDNNIIIIYFAGDNRIDPPWKV